MKFMPPIYFYILGIISIGVYHFTSIERIIPINYGYSGILFIIFGIIINFWTNKLFKEKETSVKPHKIPSYLITLGPFKISRHPMYLGMFFILLGLGFLLGNWISLIIPFIFVTLMELLFIPIEELNLEENFREDYHKYKKKVRRWI